MAGNNNEYILEVKNLTKYFPGVLALDNVSFAVKQGEIHCLCGENGAGKSTLMETLSGVHNHGTFEGSFFFNGKECIYKGLADSEADGIVIIHQELALSPYLSIAENIFLGNEKQKFGVINFEETVKAAREMMQRVGLGKLDPLTVVSDIGVGSQQLVEIAKALAKKAQLLILDEPTASLNDKESANLLTLLKDLRDNHGLTCIMVSHKLDEVLEVADSITILRDGKAVADYHLHEQPITKNDLIKAMVGRLVQMQLMRQPISGGKTKFAVKNWTVYSPFHRDKVFIDNVSFHVREGEIIGFCGLMGAGRTELMMSIFGKQFGSHSVGELFLEDKPVKFLSPKDAIGLGVCYASEDRKQLGLVLMQDVRTNVTNSNLKRCSNFMGVIREHEISRASDEYINSLRIKTNSGFAKVNTLSGGNQQKVVLGRCLYTEPKILIIDEPTRGIDVGAKSEIYDLLNALAKKGHSIIVVSSELAEVLTVADRIYVMNEGKLKGELSAAEASQEKIMQVALA